MNRILSLVARSLVTLVSLAEVGLAQDVDIRIFSSQGSGGQVLVDFPFAVPQQVFQSFCAAGTCLYSSTDPGFRTATESEPGRGLFAIAPGTQVTLEVLAVTPGASVKIGSRVLREHGEQASLGSAPSVHVHPSWQVTAPAGVTGEYRIRFRLLATGAYTPSPDYEIALSNGASAPTATPSPPVAPSATPSSAPPATATLPAPTPSSTVAPPTETATRRMTPTGTPTRAPTATPTPRSGALPGDVDCDERVTAADALALARLAAAPTAPLPCGADAHVDGQIDEGDLAILLRQLFATE